MSKSKDWPSSLRTWLLSEELPPLGDVGEAGPLIAAAQGQGLAGLLAGSIAAHPETCWPVGLREALRNAARATLVHAVRQLDAAGRVQGLLERSGLRALPLKGAALVERLYDSLADRPMGDVDLLALDDFSASVEVLRRAGFEDLEQADHAYALRDPVTGETVELHHSLTSCPGFFPIDAEGLWSRSQIGSGQIPRFPAGEDLLIQLSLHAAFQHGLVLSLVQWLDFRRLLERTPPAAEVLLELAARARAEAALYTSLEAAHVVVGAPFSALRESLAPRLPRGLGSWLQRRLKEPLSLVSPSSYPLARVRWHLAAGRRFELLRGSVLPRVPGRPREGLAGSAVHAVRRAGWLLRRWGLPALH